MSPGTRRGQRPAASRLTAAESGCQSVIGHADQAAPGVALLLRT